MNGKIVNQSVTFIVSTFATLMALGFAFTTREAARGWIADRFGDHTARAEGRLTLNPLVHIDLLGTLLLPCILLLTQSPLILGWAKPFHINTKNLRPYKKGNIILSLTGPLIHVVIAWVSVLLIHFNPNADTLGNEILIKSFQINIILAVFNMLPFPPLDGGRLIAVLLPSKLADHFLKIEPYTPLIILLLVLLPGALQTIGVHFQPLFMIMYPLINLLQKTVLYLSGHL